MKSIKPGRGPSMMSGVGAIAASLFAVFWTIMAISMGAWFMAPFGLIFLGLSISSAIYNFKNATSENRYSAFDIVDGTEEVDPLNEKYGSSHKLKDSYEEYREMDLDSEFCPYCGVKVSKEFEYCHKCGKKLP